MARRKRRRLSPRRLVALGALTLAAGGVGWLSLAANLPRAFPKSERLNEGRPDQVFREAGQALLANEGRLDDIAFERLAAAFRLEPLASDPLLFFGIRALSSNDLSGAERLLTEARRRDPRDTSVRAALLSLYLRTGRISEGAAEVAVLARIQRRSIEFLLPQLVQLARDPAARDALVGAIGDQPIMADVLALLVQDGVAPDLVLRLAVRQPRRADFAPWQQALLTRLTEAGEVARAYALWSSFVGGDRTELVYDAEFRGLPGSPPFNWELNVNAIGVAERAPGGGLELEYFGRDSGPLARQLLMLRPGRYRLEMQAEGSTTEQGSRIVLQIVCRGGGTPLVDAALRNLANAPRRLGVDLTVPAGCDAQWLNFAGVAAEFPTTQRARISGLTLRPAGG